MNSRKLMQSLLNDGLGGKGIHFLPKSGEYKSVLIWMHGLGDTADGWASMMPSLGLSNAKIVLPTAKTRPISLNGGMPMPGKLSPFPYLV
jgi:predicted esterase